ncbi:MAG: DegT/DnrJ/EryC1/StrS family aminotransferase, partial [Lentisphaeria bacterium]|nr:DegT/DnrJ/EryC1/StrS family aminotransferase [Lentisphaeria bacterium]
RQQVAKWYGEELKDLVRIPEVKKGNLSVWAQYCPRSPRYGEIQAALKEAGIPTARYYPIPIHLLKAMEFLGYKKGDMPVAEKIAETVFALPMHPYLDQATIKKIADVIRSVVR